MLKPETESAQCDSDTIGYAYNGGGLTNQKLALLGLFVTAYLKKKKIVLPMMAIKDHKKKETIPIPIGDVVDVPRILQFAKSIGTEIAEQPNAILAPGGWDYFALGSSRMAHLAKHRNVDDDISKLIFGFFESLVPHVRSLPMLERVKREVFKTYQIEVTAQFRIESDWKFHSAVTLQPTIKKPEDYHLSFDRIVEKILNTHPKTKQILVFCDEAALLTPKEEMRDVCKARFDVELFWKSDFMTIAEIASLNNLERSLFDFELALGGRIYVGLTRSTFSNMVTFEKYARTRDLVTTDYIYNNNSPTLGLRTDNGGKVDPAGAVRPIQI